MTTRSCVDDAGTLWEIFEVLPSGKGRAMERVPVEFRGGWLCFQSGTERRRLAPIPTGWEEWEDKKLLAASEHGLRTPRRTPPGMRV
jgi:hypothetical protein